MYFQVTKRFNSCNHTKMCKNFLIRHNVSAECPIKIDRTSVTLYGVTPGGTYNVDILPCTCNNGSSVKKVFAIPEGQLPAIHSAIINLIMWTIFTYTDIGSTKNENQACFPIIDNSESLFKSDCYEFSTVFIIVFSCRIYNGTHCVN